MKNTNSVSYKTYHRLLERLLAFMQEFFKEDFLSCVLFGSIARGTATKHSDIDILIVYKNGKVDPLDKFIKVLHRLRQDPEYSRLYQQGFLPDPYPVFLNLKELSGHPWVLLDIAFEGIILCDEDNILKNQLKIVKNRLNQLGAKRIGLSDGSWYWDLKPDWQPGEEIKI